MKSHKSFTYIFFLTLIILVLPSRIIFGQGVWDKKPTNLQVLPETTTPETLREMMRSFSMALDVRCEYCHEESKDGNFNSTDFASDAKDTKKVARVMMKMVQTINNNFIAEASQIDKLNGPVSCITCHRGVAHIQSLSEILFKS